MRTSKPSSLRLGGSLTTCLELRRLRDTVLTLEGHSKDLNNKINELRIKNKGLQRTRERVGEPTAEWDKLKASRCCSEKLVKILRGTKGNLDGAHRDV
jgi:hypothetical protein